MDRLDLLKWFEKVYYKPCVYLFYPGRYGLGVCFYAKQISYCETNLTTSEYTHIANRQCQGIFFYTDVIHDHHDLLNNIAETIYDVTEFLCWWLQ